MTNPTPTNTSLREYIYATYYGFIMREVWAKGGRELTTSELKHCDEITESVMDKVEALLTAKTTEARIDSKLLKAIELSGNEFAMGYDDSGCFWRFYYGSRGAGSMMDGWPRFDSQSPEVEEALDEFIQQLQHPTKEKENTA